MEICFHFIPDKMDLWLLCGFFFPLSPIIGCWKGGVWGEGSVEERRIHKIAKSLAIVSLIRQKGREMVSHHWKGRRLSKVPS